MPCNKLTLTSEGPVTTLTLNRPKVHNALDKEFCPTNSMRHCARCNGIGIAGSLSSPAQAIRFVLAMISRIL